MIIKNFKPNKYCVGLNQKLYTALIGAQTLNERQHITLISFKECAVWLPQRLRLHYLSVMNVFSLGFQIMPLASPIVNQCSSHSLLCQRQASRSKCWQCKFIGCQIKCKAKKTNLLLNRFLSSTDHFSDTLQTPSSHVWHLFTKTETLKVISH